jgi:hypothetical protein
MHYLNGTIRLIFSQESLLNIIGVYENNVSPNSEKTQVLFDRLSKGGYSNSIFFLIVRMVTNENKKHSKKHTRSDRVLLKSDYYDN